MEKFLIWNYDAINVKTIRAFKLFQENHGDYTLKICTNSEIYDTEEIPIEIINDDPEYYLNAIITIYNIMLQSEESIHVCDIIMETNILIGKN